MTQSLIPFNKENNPWEDSYSRRIHSPEEAVGTKKESLMGKLEESIY